MYKVTLILIFFLAVNIFLTNCDSNGTKSVSDSKGTLSISLTDAVANYDSVIIHFSAISAHIDSDWVHVMTDPLRVNLMEWTNGKTVLLGSGEVPAGKYTQIRIMIDSAFVGVNGTVQGLNVPSGTKTGLKLGPEFTIEEGMTYNMVLDFDACRSVVVIGQKKNPKDYKLKPHIRVISEAVSGSISGAVNNPQDVPVAHAIIGMDTITSTFVDTTSGFFKLAFLPANFYTVAIEDTADAVYTQKNVEVQNGQDTNLGTIVLQ